ncbi:8-oxo-dGTP diphosphatase [Bacillus sp. FSL W7-1360]
MQRITNCLLRDREQCLLLQKPSRGWWVAPGGKMESGESIKEAVVREFCEETGLMLVKPMLRAITTTVMMDHDEVVSEWMMFTFLATQYKGKMIQQSPEGNLEWVSADKCGHLPMANGDQYLFAHLLKGEGLMYGTFYYTRDYELIDFRLDPKPMMEEGEANESR